jgi:hypothetical protein
MKRVNVMNPCSASATGASLTDRHRSQRRSDQDGGGSY